MIDKSITIKHLEDFKKEENQYSTEQIAKYLKNNENTKSFYKIHVSKFEYYLKQNKELIEKYSKDNHEHLHLSYSREEMQIIYDIREHFLDAFWVLDLILNGYDMLEESDKTKLGYTLRVLNFDRINKLLDYVIKFGIILEQDNIRKHIQLTETEGIILRFIYEGNSVPKIAEKLQTSKHTVENHKKAICAKIDNLNMQKYKNKKALAKLNILAREYFN